jgi:hypothetical protein
MLVHIEGLRPVIAFWELGEPCRWALDAAGVRISVSYPLSLAPSFISRDRIPQEYPSDLLCWASKGPLPFGSVV